MVPGLQSAVNVPVMTAGVLSRNSADERWQRKQRKPFKLNLEPLPEPAVPELVEGSAKGSEERQTAEPEPVKG